MLNFSLKDIPLHLDIIEIAMVGEIVLFIREDMPAKTLVKHTIYKRFWGIFCRVEFLQEKNYFVLLL